MKKNKKIWLSGLALSLSSAFMPVMVISCGQGSNNEQNLVDWSKSDITQTVTGQGSSSVSPIIDGIASNADGLLQYTSTGSGKGLSSMDKATPDQAFGMTSSTKSPQGTNWADTNIRTLTWAIDAIAIAVHLPNGLSVKEDEKPLVDIDQLRNAYYGLDVTWKQLVLNLSDNNASAANEVVFVYGRQGGKSASGTSDGFMHTLLHEATLPSGVTKNEIENHEKLKADHLTKEANTEAWKSVKDKPGSLTYLSLGYALKNQVDGVQVANVKNGSETWIASIKNVSEGLYKWTRPFNIIYNTKDENAVKFAKFLLTEDIQKFVTAKDFVQLTQEQISTQIASSDYYTKSDHQMWEIIHSDASKLAKFATSKVIGAQILLGLKI